MGMVFQHFNLFNNKTVIENIMLAPVYTRCQDLKKAKRKKLFGKGGADASLASLTKEQIKKEEKEKAMSLLKRIGLEDKADVYPSDVIRWTETAYCNCTCTCYGSGCHSF